MVIQRACTIRSGFHAWAASAVDREVVSVLRTVDVELSRGRHTHLAAYSFRERRWVLTGRLKPRRADVLTWLFVVVFAYGTAVHLAQLTAGGPSGYQGAPWVIQWFFVSLVVFDPLAATLIFRRRRIGLVVGNGILVLDAVANAIVNYPPISTVSGVTAGRIGQGVVTVCALVMATATPRLWRRYR